MQKNINSRQVILVILDGWGYSALKKGNALAQANLPFFNNSWSNFPHTLLNASAESVGLRWGELGGSQVGHMTIGSGRVFPAFLSVITEAIKNKTFYSNPALKATILRAQAKNSAIHIAGLCSAGAIHSHIEHLEAILKMIKQYKFNGPVFIHVFTDGRDSPAKVALIYINKIEKMLKKYKIWGRIASVAGRYYAMDRDKRWQRTALAFKAMTGDFEAPVYESAEKAIEDAYAQNQNDEFIKPCIVTKGENTPPPRLIFGPKHYGSLKSGSIKPNDSLIFFNFRPDRMRQLTELFLLPPPSEVNITPVHQVDIVSMISYNEFYNIKVAFSRPKITNTLADILSKQGMNQLHIAETEKYAHVTYFFNAEKTEKHPLEDWIITPSPKVATYDTAPEMSALKITSNLLKATKNKFYNFILINFANGDMVGHTGDLSATIKAVETIDQQLESIYKNFPDTTIIITADHGNAEQKIDPKDESISKNHTLNPVPLIIINKNLSKKFTNPENISTTGILADITPTILDIFNLEKPSEMTGISLLDTLGLSKNDF